MGAFDDLIPSQNAAPQQTAMRGNAFSDLVPEQAPEPDTGVSDSFPMRTLQRLGVNFGEGTEANLVGQAAANYQAAGGIDSAQASLLRGALEQLDAEGLDVVPPSVRSTAGTPLGLGEYTGMSRDAFAQAIGEMEASGAAQGEAGQAEREALLAEREAFPSWYEEEGLLRQAIAGASAGLGQLGGAALSPESLLPLGAVKPGATLLANAGRGAAAGAGVNAALEPTIQQAQMNRGERDEYSLAEGALNTTLGAVLGAGFNVTPQIARSLTRSIAQRLRKPPEDVTPDDVQQFDSDELMRMAEQASQGRVMEPDQVADAVGRSTRIDPQTGEPASPAPLSGEQRAERERELGELFGQTDVLRREDVQVGPDGIEVPDGTAPLRNPTGEQANPDSYGSRTLAARTAQQLGVTLDENGIRLAARDIQADPQADPATIVRSYSQEGRSSAFETAQQRRQRREDDLATGENIDRQASTYRAAEEPYERQGQRETVLLGARRNKEGRLVAGEPVEVLGTVQQTRPNGQTEEMVRIQRGDNEPELVRASELELVQTPENPRMFGEALGQTQEPPRGVMTERGDSPEGFPASQTPQPRRAADRQADPDGLRRGRFVEGEPEPAPGPQGPTPRPRETFDGATGQPYRESDRTDMTPQGEARTDFQGEGGQIPVTRTRRPVNETGPRPLEPEEQRRMREGPPDPRDDFEVMSDADAEAFFNPSPRAEPAPQREAPAPQGRANSNAPEGLSNPETAQALRDSTADYGWQQRGGELIRDAQGRAAGRTSWLPQNEALMDALKNKKVTKDGYAKLVDRALDPDAKPLTNRQKSILEDVLEAIDPEARTRAEAAEQADMDAQFGRPDEGQAEAPRTVETRNSGTFIDTRGQGVRYHGSSTPVDTLAEYTYTDRNIYGQGFHTTDAVDIAAGYGRKGGGDNPTLHRVTVKGDPKLYDLDASLSPEVRRLIDEDLGDLVDVTDPDIATLGNALDEARAASASEGVSADVVQEMFAAVQDSLERQGYRGYRHVGGRRTGRPEHDVRIYWSPQEDLTITKDSFDNYRPDEGRADEPDFDLAPQTEASRRADEAQTQTRADEQRRAREAEGQKAQADRDADDFTLTGSDRTADEAAARGQMDLGDSPAPRAEAETAPDESVQKRAEDAALGSGGVLYAGIPLPELVKFLSESLSRATGWRSKDAKRWVDDTVDLGRDLREARERRREDVGNQRFYQKGSTTRRASQMLFGSADGELRVLADRYGSPSLRKLADVFHATAGRGDGAGRTYSERVSEHLNTGARQVQDLTDFLADSRLKSAEAQREIVRMVENPRLPRKGPKGEAANRIEKWFDQELKYQREAGVEIGEVDNYFARSIDPGKVSGMRGKAKEDRFVTQATKAYREVGYTNEQASEAARALLSKILHGDTTMKPGSPKIAGGVPTQNVKPRRFTQAAAKHLEEFYDRDVGRVMSRYLMSSTKRAEIARSSIPDADGNPIAFGDRWNNWDNVTARLTEEGVPESALNDVTTMVSVMAGVENNGTNAALMKASTFIRTIGAMSFLDRVALSSVPELFTGALRGLEGNPARDLGTLVRNTMWDVSALTRKSLKGITGVDLQSRKMAEANALAEDLGIIAGDSISYLMNARFIGDDASSALMQRVQTGFFKNVLLTQLNDYTRVKSLRHAHTFARRQALDMLTDNPRQQRRGSLFLRELGVPEGQERAFAQWFKRNGYDEAMPESGDLMGRTGEDGKFAEMYRTGMHRFVDQSVMRPDQTTRPRWTSHPAGAMAFHLLNFTWAFQKNVINRWGRLAASDDLDKLDKLMMVPGFVGASSAMYGAAFLAGEVRDEMSEMTSTREQTPRTDGFLAERALSYTGFTGKVDPLLQMFGGLRYQRGILESFAGPSIGNLVGPLEAALNTQFENSENTNTAERNLTKAVHQTLLTPAMQAGLALAPNFGLPGLAVKGMAITGVRGTREPTMDAVAGPESDKATKRRTSQPMEGLVERYVLDDGKTSSRSSGGRSAGGRSAGRSGGREAGR